MRRARMSIISMSDTFSTIKVPVSARGAGVAGAVWAAVDGAGVVVVGVWPAGLAGAVAGGGAAVPGACAAGLAGAFAGGAGGFACSGGGWYIMGGFCRT